MKILLKIIGSFFLLSLLLVGFVSAQPAGAPILSNSDKEFTLSAIGGYTTKSIHGVQNTYRSYWLKTVYGLSNRFDIFGQLGVLKLKLDAGDGLELTDKRRVAYGGGLTWKALNLQAARIGLIVSGQVIRFKAKPDFEELIPVSGSELYEVTALEYDWRELNFNFGLSKEFDMAHFYAGANLKFIIRDEFRENSLLLNNSSVSFSRTFSKYRSGAVWQPMLGLEVNLPSRLKLNFEAMGTREKDFMFYIGISQTGSP